ncbi:nicotinate-nucleotide--dimethylbenzimidazole phosphoribosyltransferase [Vibrio sp. T187]|uniref:nicotinate-nucleotide--dimethylbenzimidazole phosphoribosyltransferase n=1 Tax=Vibrio TaxID=662 RepID=UPI0010C9A05A|nr:MULTISPECIES: nicotinate-nucleotide--dimethylbenzimidazole phosphoribosyltransferase [Vibrio]MBW3694925.1 nicotinate-nucleotide--dimethylbenzimidazole phosphoribosyltransferase [Vibrio sp. T187]
MLDTKYSQEIQHRIDQKTKPLGALGQLENVAHQLALIQSQGLNKATQKIELKQPSIVIFAGDHGIADEGVSIAPSAVTQQMVLNFLHGGAAINCFCDINDIDLTVVDTGILLEVETDNAKLVRQRLGTRTENFAKQAAMQIAQVDEGIKLGKHIVSQRIEQGSNIVMFGEMGIGNTSSAAALLAALSKRSVEECVGLGTGITSEQLALKTELIQQGVGRCQGHDTLEILAEVGGFEIVQMVGGFLACLEQKTPVVVDGFIVSVAAYIATLIEPEAREYMIFAHKSEESGHQILLELLEAKPLLDLGLRLGEGTGAALALPMIKAAAQFYNHMASFESAGVTV